MTPILLSIIAIMLACVVILFLIGYSFGERAALKRVHEWSDMLIQKDERILSLIHDLVTCIRAGMWQEATRLSKELDDELR